MKKLSKILLLLLIFLCSTKEVKAYDYGIENFYINATVLNNGDLEVEEYYYLNGSYNGTTREILYANNSLPNFISDLDYYGGSKIHNGTDVSITEIKAVEKKSLISFDNIKGETFSKVDKANSGDYGVYTEEIKANGTFLKIFIPSTYDKAVYIKYTISNIAVLHNDVSELYWTIFGSNSSESIHHLNITVNFPNNQNDLRVWGHGPSNGIVNKNGEQKLTAVIDNLAAYKAVDVRATFDTSVLSSSIKKTNVKALDKIIAYETDKSNAANYTIESHAISVLQDCMKDPNRSCYKEAQIQIERIKDTEKRKKYDNELNNLYLLVVQKEEETAIENTNRAELYESYNSYIEAFKTVYILENEELKNELLNRLEIVQEKIVKAEQKSNKYINTIIIGSIFIVAIIIIFIYFKFDKEYKSDIEYEYLRDIPNNTLPSNIEYLMKKKITTNSIAANILYLANKKIIKIEKVPNENDYIFTKLDLSSQKISPAEEALINFIFENNKDTNQLSNLKKSAKKSYSSFIKRYQKVEKELSKEATLENYYEDDTKPISSDIIRFLLKIFCVISLLIMSIPLFIISLIILKLHNKKEVIISISSNKNNAQKLKSLVKFLLAVFILLSIAISLYIIIMHHFDYSPLKLIPILLISALIALIYVSKCTKRTKFGANEYAKWSSFKRFLLNFGNMDEKDLPEVALWEKYLIYAMVLGCAKKLSKTMKITINNYDDNLELNYALIYSFGEINSLLTTTINNSYSTAIREKSIHESSGGGGSWSSGSGGGGGGGGGGSVGRF